MSDTLTLEEASAILARYGLTHVDPLWFAGLTDHLAGERTQDVAVALLAIVEYLAATAPAVAADARVQGLIARMQSPAPAPAPRGPIPVDAEGRPAFVVDTFEVPEEEGYYPPPFDAEKLSFGRNLGDRVGAVRHGAWHERLPPGRRTSFTHAHSAEEELIYVLAGEPRLRVMAPGAPPAEYPLERGTFVAFPPGTGYAHCVTNPGPDDATLLVIGERRPQDDRVCYPEDAAFEAWHAANRPARHWSAGPHHR